MSHPMETFTATWLKSIEQLGKGQTPMQQWQKATADFWQSPVSYWQSVASMMGHNTNTVQALFSSTPEMFQKLAASKSWPEWVGNAMAVQGQLATTLLNAGTTSAAFRNGMMKEWMSLASRNMPQFGGWSVGTSAPVMHVATPSAAPSVVPAPVALTKPAAAPKVEKVEEPKAAAPAPKPVLAVVPPAPKPEPKPEPKAEVKAEPKAEAKPVLKQPVKLFSPAEKPSVPPAPSVAFSAKPVLATERGQRKPLFTQMPALASLQQAGATTAVASNVTSIAPQPETPSPEMPLLSGTTGTPVISSTATSVMRAASGATIAAAAAARRSVVARRQSRSRRPR